MQLIVTPLYAQSMVERVTICKCTFLIDIVLIVSDFLFKLIMCSQINTLIFNFHSIHNYTFKKINVNRQTWIPLPKIDMGIKKINFIIQNLYI